VKHAVTVLIFLGSPLYDVFVRYYIPASAQFPALCSAAVLASSTNLLYSGHRKLPHKWWGWKQLQYDFPLPVYSFTPAPASSGTRQSVRSSTTEWNVKTSRRDSSKERFNPRTSVHGPGRDLLLLLNLTSFQPKFRILSGLISFLLHGIFHT
jgi:hypothetical protein